MAKRVRQRAADVAVLDAIELMVLKVPRPTAAAVRRELLDRFSPSQVPSAKTVQDIVHDMTPADPSGPWTLQAAERDDIALVMPVLASVVEQTRGQRSAITNAEGDWIARIRRAAADLPLAAVFLTARVYMQREARGLKTTDLDLFLSWGAWRNEEAARRYYAAVYDGWAQPPPTFLAATVSDDFAIPYRVISSALHRPDEDPEQPPPLGVSPRQLVEDYDRAKQAGTTAASAKRRTKK